MWAKLLRFGGFTNMDKPSLPKGTRDFGPAQMAKRQFIFDNIRKVFQKYGFQPLETPAMENLSTLTGKYGEEGDQLLFKILDSGNYFGNLISELDKSPEIKNVVDVIWNSVVSFTLNYFSNGVEFKKIHPDEILKSFKIFQTTYEFEKENEELKDVEKEIVRSFFEQKLPVLSDSLCSLYLKSNIHSYDPQINPIEIERRMDDSRKSFNVFISELLLELTPTSQITKAISEKGLRYDLTVPFARYVVMNRNEITFPFKRYQIQPVWRADRPQKGRYREFYQCDADVVGTDSLLCEAEIVLMINEVFQSLTIGDYTIKINHRGVLSGLAELAGAKENQMSLFVAIDKLDKIGEEKVKEELMTKGFSESSLNTVFEILNFAGSIEQKIEFLNTKFSESESGKKGVNDLKEVFQTLSDYGTENSHLEFDIALARGLSYYTGCIFEVKINNVAIGSVSGGGRYDNLTGVFDSKDKNSGVGISFGVDRLYDAMEELKIFPAETQVSSRVLLCHFDAECKRYGLKILQSFRSNGIASEIYPDGVKIQKQLEYANKKMIPYTIVIGSEEMKSGLLAFKNMKTGEQQKLPLQEILKALA